MLFGAQGAQLSQAQVFEQDAAQHRGVGRQTLTHPHRATQRRDLGHIDDVSAIPHHQVARLVDGITQAGDDRLAQLGQLQRGQVFKAQAQNSQTEPVIVAGSGASQSGRCGYPSSRQSWSPRAVPS